MDLFRRMFDAAVASAKPANCLPSHLPAPPRGRTIVVGAGKASAEMARVLKRGGTAFVVTPFMYPFHPDPDDFFRPTDRELARLFGAHDLEAREMRALGEGIISAAVTCLLSETTSFLSRYLSGAFYLAIGAWVDRIAALKPHSSGRRIPVRYAVGHFASFQKA